MPLILIADDDPAQLNLRKMVLEMAGHQVAVALDPRETLRQIERHAPDLVIMDLRFLNPEGESDAREGMALIRRIRERNCRAPVLVLSGWPEEIYGQPEEKMVSRVMVKPVATPDLLRAIDELVGHSAQTT